jgi:HD-GYP domain-containing protein (c-di-GMP phosphodiesterase class II)/HAMP domain-containing protein
LAALLKRFPFYTNLEASGPDGDVFCSAIPLNVQVNVADQGYFQSALKKGDFSVGQYQVSRIPGKAEIRFAYPLIDASGQAQGVVIAGLDLHWLGGLAAAVQLPKGSVLTVVDRGGTILARHPDPEKWVGKALPGGPTARTMGDIDGVPRLYAFTPLHSTEGTTDLQLSIGIPKAVAFSQTNWIMARNLIVLGLVALLALAAAWVGGNAFILRLTNALVGAAKRLAAGDLRARTGLPHGQGELNQLAHAFDRMATSLEEREEQIRREVRRTETLARVASRLNAQLNLEAVLNAVCEETARALNVPIAVVHLYDDKEALLYPAAAFGIPPDRRSLLQTISRSTYDETLRKMGPTFLFPDVRQAPPDAINAYLKALEEARTFAVVSMMHEGELVGTLGVASLGGARPFAQDELAFLQGLADEATLAITNARLFYKAQHRLDRMQSLRSIDIAVTSSLDLNVTLSTILEQVTDQLHVDAADVLLLNPLTQTLEYAAGRGFRADAFVGISLRPGEDYAGRAVLERRIVYIADLSQTSNLKPQIPNLRSAIQNEEFIAYCAVPLIAKGHVRGVLEVFRRVPFDADLEWLEFLEALAGNAAIAVDNAVLFDALQRSHIELALAYDATIEGWSRALDLRDKETEGHTQRVTEMTMRLARLIRVSDAELVHVQRGALLHDIGKMGVPDSILLKPGPLTDEERSVMCQHPIYAYEMLFPITYLRPALNIPYCHHERWDGMGYPRRLIGDGIPLEARLFAVVDVWDALRSDRPYRAGWPAERVRDHIRSLSGTHFDPKVVEVFLEMTKRA